MRPKHLAIALLIVLIWGSNFVLIKIALVSVPPFTLLFLRFALTAFPAIFFVPRPRVPFLVVATFGLTQFALQFGALFTALHVGLQAGLASLILQLQVFFTMGLSVWLLGERPHASRWLGALVAFAGMVVVALHTGGGVPAGGLALVILSALSWSVGNMAVKRAGAVSPLALVVWGSAVTVLPTLAMALALEGPGAMAAAVSAVTIGRAAAIAYIVYAATILGYSLWAFLLGRYPSSTVAPFTLLVPVVGFIGSTLVFGEGLPSWKLAAAALVFAGLALNIFVPSPTVRTGSLIGAENRRLAPRAQT